MSDLTSVAISSSILLSTLLDIENNYFQLKTESQQITLNIIGDLLIEIKCLNCRFNIGGHSRELHCNRTARFNDDETKINCNMYKIIQNKKIKVS